MDGIITDTGRNRKKQLQIEAWEHEVFLQC